MSNKNKTARILNGWQKYLGLACCILFTSSSMAHGNKDRTVVNTDKGTIQGVKTEQGYQYRGIPYGAPPKGALRWQAPQPAQHWSHVLDASQFGPHCPQLASSTGEESFNEDCLYLNVFKPKKGKFKKHKRLPVMVWIHGGSLITGASNAYDPTELTKEGVIVVTLNYRLGALGFLAHPALSAESATSTSGNYGLMDQQLALQWVQNNIASFGGNPNKVTVFGESAGGFSIHNHLVSPQSAGLFDRAIIQSGAYTLEPPALATWEQLGLAVAAKSGCISQDTDCMRQLSVETILQNQDPGAVGYLTNVDGLRVPMSIKSAFETGQFNQVPVMEGSNRDEYLVFVAALFDLAGTPVTAENYPALISAAFGLPQAVVPYVMASYPLSNYESPSHALAAVGTDLVFSCNAQTAALSLSQYVPTYSYEFNDPNAPATFVPEILYSYKAYHAAEIQYLLGVTAYEELDENQEKLASEMRRLWARFARKGKFSKYRKANAWPKYNAETQIMKSLQPPKSTTMNDFNAIHQCDFWAAIASQS